MSITQSKLWIDRLTYTHNAPCDICGNLFYDDEQAVYRDGKKSHLECYMDHDCGVPLGDGGSTCSDMLAEKADLANDEEKITE